MACSSGVALGASSWMRERQASSKSWFIYWTGRFLVIVLKPVAYADRKVGAQNPG